MALLTGLVITCCFPDVLSPLVFVCGDFGCTVRFIWLLVVCSVGSSIGDTACNFYLFSFLVFFLCGPAVPVAPLKADFILFLSLYFQVWSAVSQVGADVTSASCVYVFTVFSSCLVVTCGFPFLFSPFGLIRYRFGASNDFICRSVT